MSYVPIEWLNDGGQPLSADNLNHMEDGIVAAVCKDGDTMTGSLILRDHFTQNDEIVSKSFVEDYIKKYIASFKDYTWRDYEFTIPAHSSQSTEFFPIDVVNGKFCKVILHKLYVGTVYGYKMGYLYPFSNGRLANGDILYDSIIFSLDETTNEINVEIGFISHTFKLENGILSVNSQWDNDFNFPDTILYFSVI